MPYTLFISDLHLCDSRPDITAAFFQFLDEHISDECDALYILGDFFEYWIGDDDNTPFIQSIKDKLLTVSKQAPLYFIHGNRDFLLGKRFANACNMTLLNESEVIDLYGRPALIMHGDSLCTKDIEYMKFRRKSRSKWWQKIMLSLPLFVRRYVAESARAKSQMNQRNVDMAILDVTEFEVLRQMSQHNVDLLIHGHTHRPKVHTLDTLTPKGERIVLGDWYTQGSYLICTPQGNSLNTLPLGNP